VLFLKTKDVFTNDHWRVIVDFETRQYEGVISTIRNDLTSITDHREELTPIAELKQLGTLLDILENRLKNFYQMVPKMDSRRNIFESSRLCSE
jgi:hypothetical protein